MFKRVRDLSLKMAAVVFMTALVFTGCASSAKAGNETPVTWDAAIKKGSLDNGMTYFVRKNAIPANRISLRLVVKAGSAMEEDDQKGVAHFVEHMAFNGTENFEKSAIVDYFEKIGMNFGADLNAYTNFEQTVYMLEVPADDPTMLETALAIMHDWACAVSFIPEEVEKERGVVTEEWRLRQNLQGRVSDKQCEILLKDSRFEDRLPIGDMDIIKNVSRDRVVDFYKKWYRPEFMSIVAVGDADTSVLSKAIEKAMAPIPASDKSVTLPKFTVPVQTEKSISIMKDKEQPYTNIFIFNPEADYKERETEEDCQHLIAKQIAASIFNTRLNEISVTPDSPWLGTGAAEAGLTLWSNNAYVAVVPKPGMTSQALMALFDQIDMFLDFGITQSELDRMKESQLSQAELIYQNRDKQMNGDLASSIVEYTLVGKIPISPESYKKIYNKIIPRITVEQVNEQARKAFSDRGTMMLVIAPQNEALPPEAELNSIWKEYKNPELAAYEDDVSDSNLMARPKNKGKVVSKKTNKNLGVNEYMLDNGIRIITKKNDFEKNYMYMSITSKGGTFQIDEKDVPSSGDVSLQYMLYSGFKTISYPQLIKKIQTKKLGVNFGVNTTAEYIQGNCKVDDSEAMLQLVNLMFTQVQFTEESWKTVMQSAKAQAEAHGSQPMDHLNDKIMEILYGKDDVYHAPFDMKFYNKLNAEAAARTYKQRFANPADFTYIFTGDFDEAKLIENCCYYLGTLQTTEDREETVYKYWDFPAGKPTATVKKGIGDQGVVYMAFGRSLPAEKDIEKSYKESFILSQLNSLMDIRLREVIREDKSGSYGIGVSAYIDGYPERFSRVSVKFGCEPGRTQELCDEVIEQIKKLQNEPVDAVYIEKLKETCRRTRETNLYENRWWINRIEAELVFTYEPEWVTKDINKLLSWITPENLQEAAKKYLNPENYVSVFLVPEK